VHDVHYKLVVIGYWPGGNPLPGGRDPPSDR
jgi:hypothetical protein